MQRRDQGPRIPSTPVATAPPRPADAWCDDAADRCYNTLIDRPLDQVAKERLTRPDRLYDVIVPLGWNDGPIVKGRSSDRLLAPVAAGILLADRPAASPDMAPEVFRKVLPRLSRHAVMVIG